MGGIFVSYRREDASSAAGWLHSHLVHAFPDAQVFLDVDTIEVGDDFLEVINRAVGSCDVLIAVIGSRWLDVTTESGGRRLDDPEDLVRLEIEAALARNVRLVPTLVEGAAMPRAKDLPPSLTGLARRHAIEIAHSRFADDAARLVQAVKRLRAAPRTTTPLVAGPEPGSTLVTPGPTRSAADEEPVLALHEHLVRHPASRSLELLRLFAQRNALTPEEIGAALRPNEDGSTLSKNQARAVLRNLGRAEKTLRTRGTISRAVLLKDFDQYEQEGAGRYGLSERDRDALQAHLEKASRADEGSTALERAQAGFVPLAENELELPRPAYPLVGRKRELADLEALLCTEDVRLVTMTGPGGTGKTRLALELARRVASAYADGVRFVGLAPLADHGLVLAAIAQATGVKEERGRPLGELVGAALHERRLLLVLDNAEHLLAAAPELAALVSECPGLTLLVTSRERLHLAAERVYPLPPLAAAEAVEFFSARARALDPSFRSSPALDELCERLDRLPLALELAAARTPLFSSEQLLDRLSQGLDLLQGDRYLEPRQRTLRATLAWSYDLLNEREQMVFAGLSVFAGSCTLEAAEQVCHAEPDTLQSLIEKSLVRRSGDRFWLLETIRAYTAERLGADDGGVLRRRHAEWFAELADRAVAHLYGPDQSSWLRLLESDHDNLRAALTCALEVGETVLVARLAVALHPFWYKHGHINEGRRWLERAVDVSVGQPLVLRARVLQAASVFAGTQDDWQRAHELAQEGLRLYRELGDRRGMAILLRDLGAAEVRRGDYAASRGLYEESLAIFRELNEPRLLATVVANLGDLAFRQGDLAQAAERTRESLALQRELGATFGVAVSLITFGFVSVCQGRDEDARVALQEAMLLAHDLGSTDNLGYAFEGLAAVAAARRDFDRAARLVGRSEAIRAMTATELEVAEQAVHKQTVAALRSQLSATELRNALTSGRELSDAAAIAVALELNAPDQI
jgi:predicted ATPase